MSETIEESVTCYALLAARSPDVLEHLYPYAPRLERALQHTFGTMIAREDLKDIVCAALIRAFETGDRFDPRRARLTTWLNTLAHYQALDFLRHHPTTTSLDALADIPAVEQTVAADDSQPSARLSAILQRLPPRRTRVLMLYYFEHASTAEIAHRLHITSAAVKAHLNHARNDLRQALLALGISSAESAALVLAATGDPPVKPPLR